MKMITPGELSINDIKLLLNESETIQLDTKCIPAIKAAEDVIKHIIANKQTVYGINTGFGLLASTRIEEADLENLQRSIVLSHACGVDKLFSDEIVRLILLLKINSLARGHSGVQLSTIEALITLFNKCIYPCIPSKGSVGASGDLAPLAHLIVPLLGEGHMRYQGNIISAKEGLELAGIKPLTLAPKEGLALLNGTQASTALALKGLLEAEDIFIAGIASGAMSVDAACGSIKPFDERISTVRGHATQIQVASMLRELLKESSILSSHSDCDKVQDPYSLRCQPQVMGACLSHLYYTCQTLVTEANAVSDNPLVFVDDNEIISGGNFHAEPVAMAADAIAVSMAEIGAISERRIALLVDPHFNTGLPAFLVENPGVNSGFMIAQVTAAALASENKSLAHPASVDSLPTSANQEDHVSMATNAGNRLLTMAENCRGIIGIELLCACQGIDLRRPLTSSPKLEAVHKLVREKVAYYAKDRYFAPDIASVAELIGKGHISSVIAQSLLA